MFIASVRPSVCLSVCLKPKFGRLKTKFDDDAGSAKRTWVGSAKWPRKTKFGPTFYIFYTRKMCRPEGEFQKGFENLSWATGRDSSHMHFVRILFPSKSTFPYIFNVFFIILDACFGRFGRFANHQIVETASRKKGAPGKAVPPAFYDRLTTWKMWAVEDVIWMYRPGSLGQLLKKLGIWFRTAGPS